MNDRRSLPLQPLIFFCLSMVIIIGCESATNYPTYSGFLGDYKGMYRSNFITGAFVIDNPQKSVTDYAKFYVAPVAVYLTPGAKAYNLSSQLLEKKARDFQETMKKAFARDYMVVDSPGEGVLVLKFAFTDLLDANAGTKAKALLEADFVDGGTGQRVVAFAYGYKAKTFEEWASALVGRLKEMEKETKVYTFDKTNK